MLILTELKLKSLKTLHFFCLGCCCSAGRHQRPLIRISLRRSWVTFFSLNWLKCFVINEHRRTRSPARPQWDAWRFDLCIVTKWESIGIIYVGDGVSSSLTALFAFALLLCQLGLQQSLIGSQTAVHLLLLLQLLAQLHHSVAQLSAPEHTNAEEALKGKPRFVTTWLLFF